MFQPSQVVDFHDKTLFETQGEWDGGMMVVSVAYYTQLSHVLSTQIRCTAVL